MTTQIVSAFTKIMLMILFGFALTKTGIFTAEMKKNVSAFLMKAVLPVNIIGSACQEFSVKSGMGMLKVLGISTAYYVLALVVLVPVCKKRFSGEKGAVFIDLAVFANVGFIGFPLLGEMLGSTGTLYTVAYNMAYQIFFFTTGLYLMKKDGTFSFAGIFKNSILYFSIASIILYFSRVRFPDVLQSVISSIGSMMIPLSMIIIGYEIGVMKLNRLYKEKLAYLISGFRLVAAPLLILLVMKAAGVEHDVAIAVTALTALPCGSLTVIAAEDCGADTSFAACSVAQSTILMIVTLPVVLMAAEIIL